MAGVGLHPMADDRTGVDADLVARQQLTQPTSHFMTLQAQATGLPTTLESTAQSLLVSGKGLLAADESFATIDKRFKEFKIPSTEENRQAYREMLLTAPGLSEYISGVILFDETFRQRIDGDSIPEFLTRQGIIPGIKVDKGTMGLPQFAGEKITQGLDSLRGRLAEYRQLGARFTKWRAVIGIGRLSPSRPCLAANARGLALFAALSQEAGLVPIVEPEIMMDGTHPLARCEEVTQATLECVFDALYEHRVGLEGMLLKTNMIVSGSDCPEQASLDEVAAATLRCFRRAVPASVPGVVFLSGGQSDGAATERLSAICARGESPWKMSFSFGRALQAPALRIWKGLSTNVPAAQGVLLHRARSNSLALKGIDLTKVSEPL
jgi:fructose-bisphosphate aldolase, class I